MRFCAVILSVKASAVLDFVALRRSSEFQRASYFSCPTDAPWLPLKPVSWVVSIGYLLDHWSRWIWPRNC